MLSIIPVLLEYIIIYETNLTNKTYTCSLLDSNGLLLLRTVWRPYNYQAIEVLAEEPRIYTHIISA